MLTVTISINGAPVYTRSVVNCTERLKDDERVKKGHPDEHLYKSDDGTILRHLPDDGAVALAIKALQTIKEVT